MPRYAVNFRHSAEKDLRRLDAFVQRRVLQVVEELSNIPRPPGCKKLEGSQSTFRVRVGDYRVIYTVNDPSLEVTIERVRHRREVYR